MIKKLLCLLVLLLTATTGTWAQAQTYKVTLQEGTEDADKWEVPAEAAEGTTVTATYSGDKKVKSVKAVKKEVIKPDLLSGVFSVSASKKVNFSKGNLQATYDGSSWTWAFANNQWDYIGNAAGNTKVTDASPFISENGTVDLFGWVGASSTWNGVNQYGITSSNKRNATDGYGNSATENLKNDWGTLMGTGWRTLTKDEWGYMLNSRSGTRYCKAQVNSKSGLVIFPDGYTHPTGPTAPTNTNTTNAEYTTNSWSGEAWTKMENAGCVFLPAAGNRDGNSVSNAGTAGTYWWSTHYEGGSDAVDRAYNLYFTNNYLLPTAGSYRDMGCSVRLVQKAPLTYPIALSAVTADYIGSVVTTDGDVYATVTAATAASKTPVAMIAYVGTASDCTHGLAIALADESGTKDYEAAGTACSGKAAVTGGTWRLPSDKDWQYMFIGCGSSESYSAPTYNPQISKSYSGLASKLTTAQGAALQTVEYWSSTKDDPNGAWIVLFNGSNATFYMADKNAEFQVRACLAF